MQHSGENPSLCCLKTWHLLAGLRLFPDSLKYEELLDGDGDFRKYCISPVAAAKLRQDFTFQKEKSSFLLLNDDNKLMSK